MERYDLKQDAHFTFLYRAKKSLLEMENRLYWSVEDKALLSIWAEERVQRQFDGV